MTHYIITIKSLNGKTILEREFLASSPSYLETFTQYGTGKKGRIAEIDYNEIKRQLLNQ